MTRSVFALLFAVAVGFSAFAQQPAPAKPSPNQPLPSLTGKWAMAVNMQMGLSRPALTLKQDGEKLTGTYTGRYGTFPLEGTIKGRAIEIYVTLDVEGQKVEMAFTGEVAADAQSMKGDADLGQAGDGTWTAAREKA